MGKWKDSKCTFTQVRIKCLENSKCLVIWLHNDLDHNVFDKNYKAKFNLVQTINDFKSIVNFVKLHGHCTVNTLTE